GHPCAELRPVTRHCLWPLHRCASPGPSERHVKKRVDCLRQGASISPLFRCQQVPLDEPVHFAGTDLDHYTRELTPVPLAVITHPSGRGRETWQALESGHR